ncbi:aminotransferase [Rhodococcus sp. NPDC059968]|uniref:aminotransferase n=1 Tax=Rhodococcus sp. NPDC059968 TaxID=3347017 RepID=UPI00366D3A41
MTDTSTQRWRLKRPAVDATSASEIAQRHYGVLGAATELGSQQDRNFRITPDRGAGLLLKINHPTVTSDEVSFQAAITDHLRNARIHTPEILASTNGARSIDVTDADGQHTTARAFQLLDGQSLIDGHLVDGAVAEELGRLAGRTTSALASLEHPASERRIQWELRSSLSVVESLIEYLPAERRARCLAAARSASAEIDSLRDRLPLQVVHGDITADNVIRDNANTLWLVDMGDASQSWRVTEIAVLAADVLGRTESLALVSRAIRGFDCEASLTDDELRAIWPLVILRGAVLAVSGWSQLAIDPENTYARERLDHEWNVFEKSLASLSAEVYSQLRLAVGRSHHEGLEYSPVVEGQNRATILDLGVTSPLLDRGHWTEPDIELSLAREALRSAAVAVARYGETRLTRISLDVTRPAKTRARLVELWVRPGTPVRAPYSGAVRVEGDAIELTDSGVVIRIDGLVIIVDEFSRTTAGEVLGYTSAIAPGVGRLSISRRLVDAVADSVFAGPTDEYETDGAADPSVILGFDPVADPIAQLRAERTRRDKAIGGANERYYAEPPQFERGWGTLLIDTQGRAYLDMVNNVAAIGHSHPRLADRVHRQLHLLNTNSRFLYAAYADFTEKVLEVSPDPSLDTVIPVNSGSEAIDLAIRLAQVATGRKGIVAVREGYHGWTMAADSVSTSAFDNPDALVSRPDWVHLTDTPNPYRGRYRGAESGHSYAQDVRSLLERLDSEGQPPAAFICEPVLGNAGGVLPPDRYLAEVYEAVRARGGLTIADEVQVGYGRLGNAFWGSTLQGVVPDIIAVAKAAGNAFPVGLVLTRREIVDSLAREGMFFSSAGGAPASAVAGSAVLDVIREEGLQKNAEIVGRYLKSRIEGLASRHSLVGPVHGSGLYLGIELIRNHETLEPATAETRWICEHLLEFGIIMQATSERQNVLKVKPPMTLTHGEADVFVNALDRALCNVTSGT